jgi:hypothetical protein
MGTFTTILAAQAALCTRHANSLERLQQLREATETFGVLKNESLTIFAAGSLGRLETGTRSDFDVFMIADAAVRAEGTPSISRLEEYEVFAALIRVNEQLQFPRFSGDGRFLKTYELRDLIKATGAPQDDSENLFTARMLLLLESQPITNRPLYERSTSEVVQNYYRDGKGRDNFHPLFLLNDILRFWRTLCLNYEVFRSDLHRPWLKKNLNLKFSRKLTIFSTVLSLVAGRGNTAADFLRLCSETPIERLARALDAVGDGNLAAGFEGCLKEYEAFIAAKELADMDSNANEQLKRDLTAAAERFGDFFHAALQSKNISDELRRYLLV